MQRVATLSTGESKCRSCENDGQWKEKHMHVNCEKTTAEYEYFRAQKAEEQPGI